MSRSLIKQSQEFTSFHTIQLYDLHSFPLDVLTYETEALVLKVTLELRVNLHRWKTFRVENPPGNKVCRS